MGNRAGYSEHEEENGASQGARDRILDGRNPVRGGMPARPSVSDDPCLTLRELSEFGTRDEPFLRRLAIEATSFLDQDKNIERVREVIVDLVLKIEIETILGGPAGELRARLHKILDVIVAKRGY